MSGVLTRLVGRATGAVMPGLRPRLPALFEPGSAATGFSEISTEAPATAPAPRRHDEARAPRNPADPPAPLSRQVAPAPPVPAPAPQPAPQATQRAVPPLPEARSPMPPQTVPDPPAPRRAPPPHRAEPQNEAAPRAMPRAAPAPLLPADPADRLHETIIERLTAGLPPAAPPALSARTDPAAEPEISIHIGRLDIRADPPPAPPRPVPPAPPAPALPSLSDYLRGGRR